MRKRLYIILLLLAGCAGPGMNTVSYLGEDIPLARTYSDFDEYKDDENNLPTDQVERIAALVRGAPVAPSYPSQDAAFEALFGLMFPGYGFSAMNLGEPVVVFALEVPKANEQRYLSFAQEGQQFVLLEDFVWPDDKGFIDAAALQDGRIVYRSHGKVVREHQL